MQRLIILDISFFGNKYFVMSKSNLKTNTGHRFISKAKTAYKIHIHTPGDKVLHRTVGFLKLGEKAGIKKAIKLRNQLGSQLWGKHWKIVLHDELLFTRLPHSLEPKIIYKPRPYDKSMVDSYYIAAWRVYDSNGNIKHRSVLGNIDKMGRLAAYNKTKRALLEAYSDYIEILMYMGRVNTLKFD